MKGAGRGRFLCEQIIKLVECTVYAHGFLAFFCFFSLADDIWTSSVCPKNPMVR